MVIVTIVNSITETSMPVNEFAFYRAKNDFNTKEILLIFDKIKKKIEHPSNIDIYYLDSSIINMRNTLQRLIKEYGDNIIFHIHHERAAICFYIASIFLNIRKHSIYTVHSTYSGRDFQYKILSLIATFFAKYVTCVSLTAYNEYNSSIKQLKGQRFTYITNGVDTDRVDVFRKKSINFDNRKTIYYIARMIPLKNHEFLLSIMARLDNYRLILIGKEDNDNKIRKMVHILHIENKVVFMGVLKRNDLYKILEPGALYLSPSTVEGLPISVLEAMRCGLIPILSNISPHREISNKIKEAIVLDYDIDKWVDRIMTYENYSNNDIANLSDLISQKVINNFSLNEMHVKYIKLYKKILAE